jgi:hypothetical protein
VKGKTHAERREHIKTSRCGALADNNKTIKNKKYSSKREIQSSKI